MQGRLLADIEGTTIMSRQGKLKLTYGAWKEKMASRTETWDAYWSREPVEETEENFNKNIMELQH